MPKDRMVSGRRLLCSLVVVCSVQAAEGVVCGGDDEAKDIDAAWASARAENFWPEAKFDLLGATLGGEGEGGDSTTTACAGFWGSLIRDQVGDLDAALTSTILQVWQLHTFEPAVRLFDDVHSLEDFYARVEACADDNPVLSKIACAAADKEEDKASSLFDLNLPQDDGSFLTWQVHYAVVLEGLTREAEANLTFAVAMKRHVDANVRCDDDDDDSVVPRNLHAAGAALDFLNALRSTTTQDAEAVDRLLELDILDAIATNPWNRKNRALGYTLAANVSSASQEQPTTTRDPSGEFVATYGVWNAIYAGTPGALVQLLLPAVTCEGRHNWMDRRATARYLDLVFSLNADTYSAEPYIRTLGNHTFFPLPAARAWASLALDSTALPAPTDADVDWLLLRQTETTTTAPQEEESTPTKKKAAKVMSPLDVFAILLLPLVFLASVSYLARPPQLDDRADSIFKATKRFLKLKRMKSAQLLVLKDDRSKSDGASKTDASVVEAKAEFFEDDDDASEEDNSDDGGKDDDDASSVQVVELSVSTTQESVGVFEYYDLDTIDESILRRYDLDLLEDIKRDDVTPRPRRTSERQDSGGGLFADREGVEELEWRDVNVDVRDRRLLYHCHGIAKASAITAILGPSGCGKTSLLNVLVGRPQRKCRQVGVITLDGVDVKPADYRERVAFVQQHDAIAPLVTVREAIAFSVILRAHNTTKDKRQKRIDVVLAALGLEHCADVYVGNSDLIKGVSGGERRRTSIAIELVAAPSMITLDEPTSGLDSESAFECISVLQQLGRAGALILMTIHQPTSSTFTLIDRVILMKRGRVVYRGDTDDIVRDFERCGYECPQHFNIADYILEVVVSLDEGALEKSGFYAEPVVRASDGRDADSVLTTSSSKKKKKKKGATVRGGLSLGTELWVLLRREAYLVSRDTSSLVSRLVVNSFIFTLTGLSYRGNGHRDWADELALQTQFGALTLISIASLAAVATAVLLNTAGQRPMFLNEFRAGTYSVPAFVTAKLLVESVVLAVQVDVTLLITSLLVTFRGSFLKLATCTWLLGLAASSTAFFFGAIAPDAKTAVELYPMVFAPQYLFSGFFVAIDDMPPILRWARFCCAFKYALNLAVLDEFQESNCRLESDDPDLAAWNCKNLKAANDVSQNNASRDIAVLISIFLVFRCLGALSLARSAQTA